MRRKLIPLVIAMVLGGVVLYLYAGGHAPAGQPALESLTAENVADIGAAFNASKDEVRVLLLLSPT